MACKDKKGKDVASEDSSTDTEDAHSRDIIKMEEEARTKRRQLSRKLRDEHTQKRRTLECGVRQQEDELWAVKLTMQKEKNAAQLVIQGLESKIDGLKDCLSGRKRHKTAAHKSQVAKIQSLIKDMKENLKKLKSDGPALDKALEKLGGDKNDSRTQKTKSLGETLFKLVDKEISTFKKNNEDIAKKQMEMDDVYKDDELQDLQKKLAEEKETLLELEGKHLEAVDNLEYKIKCLEKTRCLEEDVTLSEMKTDIQNEITTYKEDVKEVNAAMEKVISEEAKMQEHFKTTFSVKLLDQVKDFQDERDELNRKLDCLQVMVNAIESTKKAVPKKTSESLADSKDKNKLELDKLRKMKNDLVEQQKIDLKAREAKDAEHLEALEDKIDDLTKDLKDTAKEFQGAKKKLKRDIDHAEKAIAALKLSMEKQNSVEMDKVSELRGEVGKYEAMSEMLEAAKKALNDKIENERKKFAKIQESIQNQNGIEVRNKEYELAQLSEMHKKFDDRVAAFDDDLSHRTKDVRQEIENLNKQIDCLRSNNNNEEKNAYKVRAAEDKKAEELKGTICNVQMSNEVELARLKLIIENEKKDQAFASDQLRMAMQKATQRQKEMQDAHLMQIQEIMKKLLEMENCVKEKHELENKFELLNSKLHALDRAVKNLEDQHCQDVDDIKQGHARGMTELARKKEVHKGRLEKSSFVLKKVEDLENVLGTVNEQLQELKNVKDAQESEAEDLEEELAAANQHNEALERELENMSKRKKDVLRAVTVTSWSTEIQSHMDSSDVGECGPEDDDASKDPSKQQRQIAHDIYILRNRIAASNYGKQVAVDAACIDDTDVSSSSPPASKTDSNEKSNGGNGCGHEETSESSDQILEQMHTKIDIYYQKDCDKCNKKKQ